MKVKKFTNVSWYFYVTVLAFSPLHFSLSPSLECVYLKGTVLLVRDALPFYIGIEVYCMPYFIS